MKDALLGRASKTQMEAQALYAQLGELVATVPTFGGSSTLSPEVHRWLARAYALVEVIGDPVDMAMLKVETPNLTSHLPGFRHKAATNIYAVVHRALAVAELDAPAPAQGAFIPVGNAFDAHSAFSKILSVATAEALLVDPYMDDKALVDVSILLPEGTKVRLLSDERNCKPSLSPAVRSWRTQFSVRPLEARLAGPGTLHDRLLIVDKADVWVLTQSLNAFAKRSPASIVRVDSETAALKRQAYEALWFSAKPI